MNVSSEKSFLILYLLLVCEHVVSDLLIVEFDPEYRFFYFKDLFFKAPEHEYIFSKYSRNFE